MEKFEGTDGRVFIKIKHDGRGIELASILKCTKGLLLSDLKVKSGSFLMTDNLEIIVEEKKAGVVEPTVQIESEPIKQNKKSK